MKDSTYCCNSGKICIVVMLNGYSLFKKGTTGRKVILMSLPLIKNTRSFSNSCAAWKKTIFDSSASQE